jgi:hypothetical protein
MSLYNSCFVKHVTNPKLDEYKLKAVVLNIARHNLLKSVVKDKSFFLNLSLFTNAMTLCH